MLIIIDMVSTDHYFRIVNGTQDSVRVIIQGSGFEDKDIVLWSRPCEYGKYSMTFYQYTDGSKESLGAEYDIASVVDSLYVLVKENEEWLRKDIPSFWLFGNWNVYEDNFMGWQMYYSFNLTDSLMNL